MSHNHGRVECSDCHKIIKSCKCMESGKEVEFEVCLDCKTKKTQEQMQRTYELNQKLKEIGVLIDLTEIKICGYCNETFSNHKNWWNHICHE